MAGSPTAISLSKETCQAVFVCLITAVVAKKVEDYQRFNIFCFFSKLCGVGKFEMPPAVQPETIAETHEEEQNLSSNNSNSDDTARLIDQSQPQPDPLLSREHSNEKGLVQIDTPEYEQQLSKMVEEQRLTEETVEDDSQKTSLIASSNGNRNFYTMLTFLNRQDIF